MLFHLFAFVLRATSPSRRNEAGQSTAEYALVICAAAAIVGLLITWISSTNPITGIFGRVVTWVTSFIG